MTRKERTIAAIEHRDTDITPYHVKFTKDMAKKMATFYDDADFESKIGNHMVLIDAIPPDESVKPGYVRDEFGVIWNRTIDKDIGVVDKYLVNPSNVATFEFPDLRKTGLYERLDSALSDNPELFTCLNIGHGLFERAWMLYGIEDLLTDMILNPPVVDKLLDRLLEYHLGVIDYAGQFPELDCVHYGDDWGQQHGLIMGATYWRRYIKPRIKIMHERIKSIGKYVYMHTCGDIGEILPEMIESGIDLYDPFQPEVFDIFEMKRRYGNDITFFGGISLQKTLPFGSAQDVRLETRRNCEELSRGGGYIAAPAHAITADVPEQNIDAMLKELMGQDQT